MAFGTAVVVDVDAVVGVIERIVDVTAGSVAAAVVAVVVVVVAVVVVPLVRVVRSLRSDGSTSHTISITTTIACPLLLNRSYPAHVRSNYCQQACQHEHATVVSNYAVCHVLFPLAFRIP